MSHMETGEKPNNDILSGKGDSRREFIKQTLVAATALATVDSISASAKELADTNKFQDSEPWYRTITRWGQVNITEKDPERYDIEWWRKYWKRTETQGVVINAGGIVAYYPSKIPLHQHAQYLNGIDLFGKLTKAAHDDGLAVFARMDSNRAHEEFYKAHPDWFSIDASGKPYKAGELYISCIFSPYYTEHLTAVLREISELYKPEGFTDNSWSGQGRDSICYCGNCRKSFMARSGREIPRIKNWDDKTYQEWIRWNYDRRLEIWDLNNKTTKAAGGPNCIWAGMNSGSISGQSRSFRDYKEIGKRAAIIMLDDQARNDAEGFQHNGEIGKILHGLIGWEKLVPESMAMYQAGRPQFRVASKPTAEARMWMINGIAGGIQPWWHHVAAYHEDRRMYQTAAPVFKWQKQNEAYLIKRKPVATVGVVWSQQNTDFYGRDNAADLVDLPWRGMTQALLRARIPYLPIHADHIDRDASQFAVLILPNLASMNIDQVNSVKKFVAGGGSLIATGETSLYDEWGSKRNDYALAELFGAHFVNNADKQKSLPKLAGNVYHTYLRLSPELRSQVDGPKVGGEPIITGKRHQVLEGFEQTDLLPFGGLLDYLRIDEGVEIPMTLVPQFPVYPPETAWMSEPKTNIAGMVISSKSNGRVIFLPADIDKQFGLNNLPDHGNLLKNIVRWAAKDGMPLTVEGAGLVDCHLYQQPGRLILHVVNLTSAATWRAPLDELIAIGPLQISVKLPRDVTGKKLQLLVNNQKIISAISGGRAQFTIDKIMDHECIVIS